MTQLKVANLSYSYGAKQALDNVSFQLEAGTFCALLGPNGAGKSTLFNLLTRLFVSPQGQIEIAGYNISTHARPALERLGIVFQQTTLDMDLTVRQNLSYFSALHGLSGRDAAKRIDAALDRLSMLERSREKVRALNGGHRRRTEIARALIHCPSVLLLDEPTVGLDASARQSITDHVHDLTAEGTTILWAAHLTDEVRPDDRLIILHQAKILANGIACEIADETPIADKFLEMTQ